MPTKVHISAARGAIVLWLPGVVDFVLRYAKKVHIAIARGTIVLWLPGVVAFMLRYAKKIHISAARGTIVLWRAWHGFSLSAEVCQKS
jgi:hypothetical protein